MLFSYPNSIPIIRVYISCLAFHHLRSYPEPLDHVLLLLVIGGRVKDEAAGEVGLVEAHEHVLVHHVLQHQQLHTQHTKLYASSLFAKPQKLLNMLRNCLYDVKSTASICT